MLGAIHACLIPIARLLLRSGITYAHFAEVAKRAFVGEAFQEVGVRGRRTNASRVAAATGLSRKEVRRIAMALKDSDGEEQTLLHDNSGPLAKVLHAWHVDSRFTTAAGLPRVLPYEGESSSFSSLVRAVAGDIPAGAVRTELKNAGAIAEHADGSIEIRKRYYVPGNFDEKAITVMSGMLFPMIASVEHNANPHRKSDGFIQRYAFSKSLSVAAVTAFRLWERGEATKFVEMVDDWLAKNECEEGAPESETEPRVGAGVGVFYYEGPSADDVTKRN